MFDSKGVADPNEEIKFGPNIKDWPKMSALPENLVLRCVSEIHDPVTTTDELIPSGETSSYRSSRPASAMPVFTQKPEEDPVTPIMPVMSEQAIAEADSAQAEKAAEQAGEDPFDSIFKIFNTK